MHTLQVHAPGAFVCGLSPAAAQSKPTEGATGGLGGSNPAVGSVVLESGRGSSQETHLALAASLSTMQTLHDHVPGAFVGALSPAAAQSKPAMGAADLGSSDTASGTEFFDVESGRGASHATHSTFAVSLGTMQTLHVHDPVAFIGCFIPAASQLKPVGAGADFAPNVNANIGREDKSATEAAPRSLAWFRGTWELVSTSKENDGRDAGSRERAACFGSLGADFIGCDPILGPGSGGGVVTAGGCFGAGSEVKESRGCSATRAGVSKTDFVGGGESGPLSAANPNRSLDGSFGAEDLSGNEDLVATPNRLPFDIGGFLALG
jgi:hypothetical protein